MGTMASLGSLALARDAFKRQAWNAARAAYAASAPGETLTLAILSTMLSLPISPARRARARTFCCAATGSSYVAMT
jgi:hypothetical protein